MNPSMAFESMANLNASPAMVHALRHAHGEALDALQGFLTAFLDTAASKDATFTKKQQQQFAIILEKSAWDTGIVAALEKASAAQQQQQSQAKPPGSPGRPPKSNMAPPAAKLAERMRG